VALIPSRPPALQPLPVSAAPAKLFRIAQTGTVRVLVNVRQVNASSIRDGQAASVYVLEFSKRVFPGKVTCTSRSLDESARTLVVEADVSNPEYLLLPGMYAQIQFTDGLIDPPLLVPGDSIMAMPDGLEVAVLTDPTHSSARNSSRRRTGARKEAGIESDPRLVGALRLRVRAGASDTPAMVRPACRNLSPAARACCDFQ
jgi:multidrug efflux pump subunit AcrA (membrane-fusion protein)